MPPRRSAAARASWRRREWIAPRPRARLLALALVAATAAAVAAPAPANQPPLTTKGTITGDAGADYSELRSGPRWRRVVREELGGAEPGRKSRRRSLIYFTALDEIHYTDEESPARVEFLDITDSPFTSAWFPFEALRPFSIDRVFRTVNSFQRSPVAQGDGSRARMALALTTGDNYDNQQKDEAAAFVRLLDGGRVDPNTGVRTNACPAGPVDPAEPPNYTGVQDYDDYRETPTFYDPDQPEGFWESWPEYQGLMDRAQRPFRAAGLDVPSYISLGNHDRLQQGNQFSNAAFEAVATGCAKVFGPVPFSRLEPGFPGIDPSLVEAVPRDPARRSLSYPQMQELLSGSQADGHGFDYVDDDQLEASNGAASYYSWRPKPGVRMISLNTTSEGGVTGLSSNGNLDDPQFRWLQRELRRAQERDELVVLFGHHPVDSLTSPVPDEAAPPCGGGPGRDPNAGCDRDPRGSTPIHDGGDLASLLKATPNAVAYVAGHTTVNRVTPFPRRGEGGFWQIESGAVSDWPNQARLLELMDNRDGTLSIFGTMLSQHTRIETPPSGASAQDFTPKTLASVDRVLAFHDPQDDPEETVGLPEDRNVELLIRDPRDERRGGGGPGGGGSGDGDTGDRPGGDEDGGSPAGDAPEGDSEQEASEPVRVSPDVAAAAGAGEDGQLPFTGLPLLLLAAVGAIAAGSGAILRRRAQS